MTMITTTTDAFTTFFQDAPPAVDIDSIRAAWKRLAPPYDVERWQLPLPPWNRRQYDERGEVPWETLQRDLAADQTARPMCIYLHSPFCDDKCGFCDSYSFRLATHRDERITQYVEQLCTELEWWSRIGNLRERRVVSVHMGGGTPTFLGAKALTQIADCCKRLFNITPETEWALESTAHGLTPEVIRTMHEIGYRRLHIGVQSLEDEVRQVIGRTSTADQVVERIEAVRALDWIVSVDLICGLPRQTLAGFIGGIERLMEAGINGYSLYELLIFPQNLRWSEKHGLTQRSHLPNYWMYMAGATLLEQRGFTKNLFNHWADARDENIYFTFPQRDEDLLAVGAIADGVFGDYHYRHFGYNEYLQVSAEGRPALEGGLRRTAREQQLQPLITGILSSKIEPAQWAALGGTAACAEVIRQWKKRGLVTADKQKRLTLTPSGSWFAGNLITELDQVAAVTQEDGLLTLG